MPTRVSLPWLFDLEDFHRLLLASDNRFSSIADFCSDEHSRKRSIVGNGLRIMLPEHHVAPDLECALSLSDHIFRGHNTSHRNLACLLWFDDAGVVADSDHFTELVRPHVLIPLSLLVGEVVVEGFSTFTTAGSHLLTRFLDAVAESRDFPIEGVEVFLGEIVVGQGLFRYCYGRLAASLSASSILLANIWPFLLRRNAAIF